MRIPAVIIIAFLACSPLIAHSGATAEPPAETAVPAAADSDSSSALAGAWEWFDKGGPIMYPIALISLVGLAFVIERIVALRRNHLVPKDLQNLLEERIRAGDIGGAVEVCDQVPSSLGRVMRSALERRAGTIEEMERAAEATGSRELWRMQRNIRPVGVVGNIAPLLGLLGTVFGMIGAFQTLSEGQAVGNPSAFAHDIYMALLTTFFGLSIAIPMVICFHWLRGKAETRISEIEEITGDLLLRIHHPEPTPDREEDA